MQFFSPFQSVNFTREKFCHAVRVFPEMKDIVSEFAKWIFVLLHDFSDLI